MTREEFFDDLSKGNADAKAFCFAYFEFAHALDDLIDRDHPDREEWACVAILRMLHVMARNPFVQEHFDALWPLIHTAATSYIFANQMEKQEDTKSKVVAGVVKSEWGNVLLMVAHITGGIEHQLACQSRHRLFDFS